MQRRIQRIETLIDKIRILLNDTPCAVPNFRMTEAEPASRHSSNPELVLKYGYDPTIPTESEVITPITTTTTTIIEEDKPLTMINPATITTVATAVQSGIMMANAGVAIWDVIHKWLHDPPNKHKLVIQSFMRMTKQIRQLLFDRDKKARAKYGQGLATDTKITGDNIEEASKRIADAIYWLTREKEQPSTTRTKHQTEDLLRIVQELMNLTNLLINDLSDGQKTSTKNR